MCQYWLINDNKCISLIQDVNYGENWYLVLGGWGCHMGTLYFPLSFSLNLKLLKRSLFISKNAIMSENI